MWILHAEPGGQHSTIRASEGDDRAAGSTRRGGLDVVNEYSKVSQCLLRTQVTNMLQSLSCSEQRT